MSFEELLWCIFYAIFYYYTLQSMEKQDKIARQERKSYMTLMASVVVGLIVLVCVLILEERPSPTSVSNVLEKEFHQSPSLDELEQTFNEIEDEVRRIKATGVIMETDSKSLEATGRLQEAARDLCKAKYGALEPYHIQVQVQFQNEDAEQEFAEFTIETAPLSLIPYSVYNFLEVVRGYQSGGFHRKASHVLQVTVKSDERKNPLAFQEYSPQFPHQKKTVGYCGRPSGFHGCWYISTLDNTRNHGPGSQQKQNPHEADANFGKIIEGYDEVEPMIRKALPKDGFIGDQKNWVLIPKMRILVPDGSGGYREWEEVEEI